MRSRTLVVVFSVALRFVTLLAPCSCILFVPIDVLKERMQIQRIRRDGTAMVPNQTFYRNTPDAIRQIMQYEGIRGVYRGYGATVMSFGPFSALYFLFYEQLKAVAQRKTNSAGSDIPFFPSMVWCVLQRDGLNAQVFAWLPETKEFSPFRSCFLPPSLSPLAVRLRLGAVPPG